MKKGRVVEFSLTLNFNACCDRQTFILNISRRYIYINSESASFGYKINSRYFMAGQFSNSMQPTIVVVCLLYADIAHRVHSLLIEWINVIAIVAAILSLIYPSMIDRRVGVFHSSSIV